MFASLVRKFSPRLNQPCQLINEAGEKLHTHIQIGQLGEDIACSHLRAEGRKILYRNYRGPKGGEIDIVARDGKVLSFVEVKTRTSTARGRPLDAVDNAKQELIERGANSWLKLLGTRSLPWRFDVVEVILTHGEKPSAHTVLNVF